MLGRGGTVALLHPRLDRAGLEHEGSRILEDTVDAVGGDEAAEGRAVSYCDGTGFETLVGPPGQSGSVPSARSVPSALGDRPGDRTSRGGRACPGGGQDGGWRTESMT